MHYFAVPFKTVSRWIGKDPPFQNPRMFSDEVLFYEHGYITAFETTAAAESGWGDEFIYGFRARLSFFLNKTEHSFHHYLLAKKIWRLSKY